MTAAPAFPVLAVRWHGRGGQGAKTAAALLAELVIDDGGCAQASPEFGPERRGAPVAAYTRIGPAPIRRRGPIEAPDVVILLDRRLAAAEGTLAGVTSWTTLLVNAPAGEIVAGALPGSVITLDASAIARRTIRRDIPNIPMLAAAAALFLPLAPEAVLEWLGRRLAAGFRGEVVAGNLTAARDAMAEMAHEHLVAVS